MPIRIKMSPKFSFDFLGVSVGVEFPTSDPAFLDGPPVSDGRFERARQLAGESMTALRDDDLPRAVDRLMALADEYPIEQRAHAVKASNRVRLLMESSEILSEARLLERRDELVAMILEAIAVYQDTAGEAQRTRGQRPAARRAPGPTDSGLSRDAADNPTAAGSSPATAVGGPAPAVRCQDLGWQVEGRRILSNVSIDLMSGSIVGVVGRNGAGKTTLLRLLARELRPSGGSVSYPQLTERGYRSERVLDRIAYVPQIPIEYVGGLEANLLKFAALRGLQGHALEQEVEYVLERFGLGDRGEARWSALAGGYRTRVDLARSTLASPDILILDEPLGPLDRFAQRDYLRHLRDLADSRRGVCIVITSQDIQAIADIADHILVVRNGIIPFSGPPTQIERTLGHRSYEFAGRLSMTELQTAISRLPHSELREEGDTRVLIADGSVTSRDVLKALIAGGETIRYFRDTSRSPQGLLTDA